MVLIMGSAAATTKPHGYRIETANGEVAERPGVATSTLNKENGRWEIAIMHNFARRTRAS